jgi:hypothetical protein
MSLFSYILYDTSILFTLTILKTSGYLIYYGGSYLYNKKYYNKQEQKINELRNEIIELNKIITEIKEESDTEFDIILIQHNDIN